VAHTYYGAIHVQSWRSKNYGIKHQGICRKGLRPEVPLYGIRVATTQTQFSPRVVDW
jgi:hypothetical protein